MLKVLHNVIDIIIVLLDWKEERSSNNKASNKKKYWELHRFHLSETFSVSVLCLIFTAFNSVIWFSMRWFFGSCYNWLISSVEKPTKGAYDRTISTSNTIFFPSFSILLFPAFVCFALFSCSALRVMLVKCQSLPCHSAECNKLMEIYRKKKLSYVQCSHSRFQFSGIWTLNILGTQLLFLRYCCLFFFIRWFSRVSSSI